ncbi:MAG: arginine repressor [Ruminococcaceae bacterium]|nr:arginine repressor [Oscillospiraceae bacterium]
MKSLRHGKILEIITKYDVETQEELTEYLKKEGFAVTQATVSRDIKALRLIKTAAGTHGNENKYKYAVNKNGDDSSGVPEAKFRTILDHSLVSSDHAGNLVVLKTYAGMAQASAAAIDSMNIDNILGTIAGDDTILIVMRTENEAAEFVRKIERLTK